MALPEIRISHRIQALASLTFYRACTVTEVTFDPRHCDILLVTNHSYGLVRLLRETKAIIPRADLSCAVLITIRGHSTLSIDIDLSRYITKTLKSGSISIPLGKSTSALKLGHVPTQVFNEWQIAKPLGCIQIWYPDDINRSQHPSLPEAS